jgi:alpha-galactosidase
MNQEFETRRRTFLQMLAAAAMGTGAGVAEAEAALSATGAAQAVPRNGKHIARVGDERMVLEMDEQMRTRVSIKHGGHVLALTGVDDSEYLRLKSGKLITKFALSAQAVDVITGPHGKGVRHRFTGSSAEGVEKTVLVSLYERYPGFAVMNVGYRHNGKDALPVAAWVNGQHTLKARGPVDFWSFSGASFADRRDWVQPVQPGFTQRNFMGMNASDYGGGTPVTDVWHRDGGIAVGHIETTPKLVALPLQAVIGGARLAVEYETAVTLMPGDTLTSVDTFITVHRGDYFASLDTYRQLMAERGLRAPNAPAESYEPVWCAWGYERGFTVELMEGTLAKAKDLGLEWAVMDDGWQNAIGDWQLDRKKFPNGDADMKSLVGKVRKAGMKPRLWVAPLAVNPGTDLLHDHTDMLLLDKDGAVQNITWWNSFYLCPAYDKTLEHTKALVRKILGEWGYDGLKIDGQHLNGVAPCYNPAHKHARPEESVERLQDFWKAVYDTAMEINPHAVVEICPCGDSFAFHNMPYMNQTPAADPLSSWQVRLKGKTTKALMGPSAPFAGDHVELSDRADDFASSVGIGAVVSTKFTWPAMPGVANPFLLTEEKEQVWRKWIGLYKEKMLPQGVYRGTLYDIGFDKPETHVVEKDGVLYYAFYAPRWSGAIDIRGLTAGRAYRLRDYFNDRDLGQLAAGQKRLNVSFERFLLVEAVPVAA